MRFTVTYTRGFYDPWVDRHIRKSSVAKVNGFPNQGGINTWMEHISQLGVLFPINGKNVPNHQPVRICYNYASLDESSSQAGWKIMHN